MITGIHLIFFLIFSLGIPFRSAIVTSDNNHIIVVTVDKANKDSISVFNLSGNQVHKIALRTYNIKVTLETQNSPRELCMKK